MSSASSSVPWLRSYPPTTRRRATATNNRRNSSRTRECPTAPSRSSLTLSSSSSYCRGIGIVYSVEPIQSEYHAKSWVAERVLPPRQKLPTKISYWTRRSILLYNSSLLKIVQKSTTRKSCFRFGLVYIWKTGIVTVYCYMLCYCFILDPSSSVSNSP